MEYIKERRAWEERLNRRAPIQTEPEDSGMDDMDQEMDFRGEKCAKERLQEDS